MGPCWTACCREANKKNFYAEVKAQTGVDLQQGPATKAKREWEILKVENDKDDPNKVIIVLQHYGADGVPVKGKDGEDETHTMKVPGKYYEDIIE